MSATFTDIVVILLLIFILLTESIFWYLCSVILLSLGYGLTYSVINGMAANEEPKQYMPQYLLLFSYFTL
jgi:ABC-type nickel/cobalt efflux system permease component RcnA